jgi:terminase small subunit-like protein
MPRAVRSKATRSAKPKRPAHRPTKFTPELGEKICELIACGWLMKDAARHFDVAPETVCRWRLKHDDFRALYEQARLDRLDTWSEEMIDIADDRDGDYEVAANGKAISAKEAVLRSRLKIASRQWLIARQMPQQWGDRQEVDVNHDWSHLPEEERVRKALELLGVVREVVNRDTSPRPILYNSEDGDVLAEEERRQRQLAYQGTEEEGMDDSARNLRRR